MICLLNSTANPANGAGVIVVDSHLTIGANKTVSSRKFVAQLFRLKVLSFSNKGFACSFVFL